MMEFKTAQDVSLYNCAEHVCATTYTRGTFPYGSSVEGYNHEIRYVTNVSKRDSLETVHLRPVLDRIDDGSTSAIEFLRCPALTLLLV